MAFCVRPPLQERASATFFVANSLSFSSSGSREELDAEAVRHTVWLLTAAGVAFWRGGAASEEAAPGQAPGGDVTEVPAPAPAAAATAACVESAPAAGPPAVAGGQAGSAEAAAPAAAAQAAAEQPAADAADLPATDAAQPRSAAGAAAPGAGAAEAAYSFPQFEVLEELPAGHHFESAASAADNPRCMLAWLAFWTDQAFWTSWISPRLETDHWALALSIAIRPASFALEESPLPPEGKSGGDTAASVSPM